MSPRLAFIADNSAGYCGKRDHKNVLVYTLNKFDFTHFKILFKLIKGDELSFG